MHAYKKKKKKIMHVKYTLQNHLVWKSNEKSAKYTEHKKIQGYIAT